ncbi:UNVERIFIED_CONTAM: hypothetical protein GTU68_017752 [Idotea baltica]|nr:hypothetical protein [Idotea baltica]
MDGESGLDQAMRVQPDLIILDVMLPGINGYEICRHLRAEGLQIPIIFLTAKGEESDILLGLGLGADDYLAKPFSIRELLARSEAVLRRSGGASDSTPATAKNRVFGDFELDVAAHKLRLKRTGEAVKLSPKEYSLLVFLVDNAGAALSRDRIMDEVWGYDARVTTRSVDRFITTLRKKIEPDPKTTRWIETIREFGYRFKAMKVEK